jgi:polar amino acid transport system substrate-binding protein
MKKILAAVATASALLLGAANAQADALTDKAKAGEPIRIGFAHEIPWAYPGEQNEPLGFANALALGVLKEMGYTNIEPVVTEWGGLIPGLQAGRYDIITGGMYITGARCKNVAFAEPMGKFGDAFIVPAGNPKGINTFEDIKNKDATLVTVAGFVTVDAALKAGVPESKILQVPGVTEVLAAVRAGRADVGGGNYFAMKDLVKSSGGAVEVTDPAAMPESLNWVAIAFKKEDQDFLNAFNEAQAKYIGTPEMLESVGKFEYTETQLPGDAKTDWICENR